VKVEPGKAEHGVGGRSKRQVAGELGDQSLEQVARRRDETRDPGGGEHVAERPDRATDMVAKVRLVEPATVVAHEVAHSPGAGGEAQARAPPAALKRSPRPPRARRARSR